MPASGARPDERSLIAQEVAVVPAVIELFCEEDFFLLLSFFFFLPLSPFFPLEVWGKGDNAAVFL